MHPGSEYHTVLWSPQAMLALSPTQAWLADSLSPCHLVTLSPFHLVTLSPCHLVTLSPFAFCDAAHDPPAYCDHAADQIDQGKETPEATSEYPELPIGYCKQSQPVAARMRDKLFYLLAG